MSKPWSEMSRAEKHAAYDAFLRAKVCVAGLDGIEIDPAEVHPILKPHQRDAVLWALRGGRRALFESFGLGKSIQALEINRLLLKHVGGRHLIVVPLGVRQEFFRDAKLNGVTLGFVRSIEECDETGIYITNYETVREGKLDLRHFLSVTLDESAVLRGLGGSKTFREFMKLGQGVRFKFVATATPAPNDYIELLSYSEFLEVLDVGQAKTRWFKRNSEKADQLTLHEHKRREFLMWLSSWALFLQKPSDLNYSDEGYELPDIDIRWHEIPSDHTDAGEEVNGQMRIVRSDAIGVVGASREKRSSLKDRVGKMAEIVRGVHADGSDQFIVWVDLNDEQHAVEKALDRVGISHSSLTGSMPIEKREELLDQWRDRQTRAFVSKPVMYGAGVNLQQCAHAVFLGIGFKFADFIQAIKRIHRFLQTRRVRIDLIYTEAERPVRETLERKWQQHNELTAEMSAIIREFDLAQNALAMAMQRSMGLDRVEASGQGWRMVHNDCVHESIDMDDATVDVIVSSLPFSTQYEYSPSFNDFGHNEDNEHFWQQMDFLTPELLRALKPGRICAIHVKDRIVPGGINKLGFQTVYPFHADAIAHFQRHGFAYMGMKTIVTDVVRENKQTYRLGWSEQCKDGTKMGVGMPEYLLIFRKPPSDTTNSYADEPVRKAKPNCVTDDGELVPFERNLPIAPGTGYSRGRWQIDAHGYARSSGNRLLMPEDFQGRTHDEIFRLFREYSRGQVYDYEHHVRLTEALEAKMILPVTFMLLQPQSWSPEVWSDVTRMRTLNTTQAQKGAEQHLCPLPIDLVQRAVRQWTNEGEIVFDPFAGLGSVPMVAVEMRRVGWGVELSPRYWVDAVGYCKAAESKVSMPTLFDLIEGEADLEVA